MRKPDYENVSKILLAAGFSTELVQASRKASEKGSDRTHPPNTKPRAM